MLKEITLTALQLRELQKNYYIRNNFDGQLKPVVDDYVFISCMRYPSFAIISVYNEAREVIAKGVGGIVINDELTFEETVTCYVVEPEQQKVILMSDKNVVLLMEEYGYVPEYEGWRVDQYKPNHFRLYDNKGVRWGEGTGSFHDFDNYIEFNKYIGSEENELVETLFADMQKILDSKEHSIKERLESYGLFHSTYKYYLI